MQNEKIIIILIAILGAAVAVNLLSGTIYKLSAFEVELSVNISGNNFTEISFPPVGKIIADTHSFPLNFKIAVLNVNPDRLRNLTENIENKEEFLDIIKDRGKNILQFFILRILLIGFMGGFFGIFILGKRDWMSLLSGGLIGLILLSVLITGTYFTYDFNGFNDPNYEGMLSAAPWMFGLIEEGLNNIDQLGEEMERVTTNISNLFTEVEGLRPLGGVTGQVKVLHVSDIHNNPVALDFIKKAVDSFKVDLIIDTGDITDYGTPLEAQLLESINKLEIPYVFVPGNHDSPAIIEKMEGFDNVVVLKDNTIKIKELIITGIGDPAATTKEAKPPEQKMIKEYQEELQTLLQQLAEPSHIVASHNFAIASPILGETSVLLHGHDHKFKISEEEGTTIIDAGTTGAAGIRGLQSKKGIPYTANLLHFSNNKEEIQLKAVDIIKIYSRESSFTLERKGIENSQSKEAGKQN